MKGFFVTGTDTGVGKTAIAAGLLGFLRGNKINAAPMKPVQSGAAKVDGELVSQDLNFSLKCGGMNLPGAEIRALSPFLYEPACSPHLAGKLERRYFKISAVIKNLKKIGRQYDCALVEGAGGVMVPLNKNETMLDLMREINFPVILVSRGGLGAINHALLSIRALRESGLEIAGVIINNLTPGNKKDEFIRKDNIDAISKFGGVKILGIVDFFPQLLKNRKKFLSHFESCLLEKDMLLDYLRYNKKTRRIFNV